MERKVIFLTQAYCKAELLAITMPNIYNTKRLQNVEHWININHYPVDEENNISKIKDLANQFGCKIWDNEFDRGLHKGFNNWLINNPQPQGTFLIGIDPDTMIEDMSSGWDKALVEVMTEDTSIACASLWSLGVDQVKEKLIPLQIKQCIAGHAVSSWPFPQMYNLSCFDLDFISSNGGLQEPNEYYGGLELWLSKCYEKDNRRQVYLTEYHERYFDFVGAGAIDQSYLDWKNAHVFYGFTGSFKEFLNCEGQYDKKYKPIVV